MDDIVVRPRYPRYKTSRRKRRYGRNSNEFTQKLALQIVICISILAISCIIKYVDTPFTNYLENMFSAAIMKDIEVKGIYEDIDNYVNALIKGTESRKDAEAGFDEATLPASTTEGSLIGEEYVKNTNTGMIDETAGEKTIQSENDMTARVSSIHTENAMLPEGQSLLVPVEGFLGSPFGMRMHPIKKEEAFHRGVDIEANKGAPIKAVLAGEVVEAGTEKTLGKYLKIKHLNGFISVYAHCSSILAQKGQKVKQGEIVAKVGNTGASVGSHLHFELWKDGNPVDPQQYFIIPVKE